MISVSEIEKAITNCQGDRNPDANTCIKLAAYYVILDHIDAKAKSLSRMSFASEPVEKVRFNGNSEFSEVIQGLKASDVIAVMDDLMDAVQGLMPRLYTATIEKLKAL